jgi:Putative transposase/Transposase zinc-binding domain
MQTISELRIALQQKIFSHSYCKTFNSYSRAVLQKLSACHTVKIGLHVYQCDSCKKEHHQYHSCNNRHCPNCGGLKREQWILDRHSELLPTSYFHLVFTLPAQLRSLCMGNRKEMFNLLFTASSHTIQKLCNQEKHLGATPGIVTVLHTNGQDLNFHPHVHCIVTGGGVLAHTNVHTIITEDGECLDKKVTTHTWVNAKRKNGTYFLPRSLLADNFRDKYLQELVNLFDAGKLKTTATELQNLLDAVQQLQWNVYAKASFGGPVQVIEYLARYTHKVAITVHRIVSITDTHICFTYKDYADGYKQKRRIFTQV